MRKNSIALLIIASLINIAFADNYTLNLISQKNGASCLDGSAPGLYVYEGKNTNKDSFIVYFQGGGYCGAGSLADTL